MEELRPKFTTRNGVGSHSQENGNESWNTTTFIFTFLESYMFFIVFLNMHISVVWIRKYYLLAKIMRKHSYMFFFCLRQINPVFFFNYSIKNCKWNNINSDKDFNLNWIYAILFHIHIYLYNIIYCYLQNKSFPTENR